MNAMPNNDLEKLAEENHFVYIANEDLPSLQEMASLQIALAIWNGYTSRCSANKRDFSKTIFVEALGIYSSYREDTDTLVESLKTPRSIETILKTRLEKVREEMEQWVRCFIHEILFCHYRDVRRITAFKSYWCVWLPNGKIDYLKTAENVVSSENNEFDLKTKFAIMCEFYMEEKLEKFPLDSLPADFIETLFQIQTIDSTRYWIKYLTGKCEEINAYGMVANCMLLDGLGGIRSNRFWHRLSDDDQVRAVYNMLVDRYAIYPEKWLAVEPLLGSMSWDQQSRLLSMPKAGRRIIIFSCCYSSSSKCAVWAWTYCRDFTTAEEFCSMMRDILSSALRKPLKFNHNVKEVAYQTAAKLLDAAYDHHQNFSMSSITDFLETMMCRGITPDVKDDYSSSMYILLNKFLALESVNGKKALLMKFAVQLATGTRDPCHIQEILDLNLPHPDDQTEFKSCVINSKQMMWRCVKLWINGNFDILNASIEYFCNGDVITIRKYNRKLLSGNWAGSADKSVITDVEKWHECCKLIDEIFPDNPAKALVSKQLFVSSFLKGKPLNFDRLRKYFDVAIKTIESVFLNEAELNRVKTDFIKAHSTSCELYFHSMIEWCCNNNEEAVIELKNIMKTHDTIFNLIFFELNKVYVTEGTGLNKSLLTHLDKYLSWYLANEDENMAYKMRRLNESDELEIFTTIVKQRDEQALKMLHEWFFDGDEEKARDFRSKKIRFW